MAGTVQKYSSGQSSVAAKRFGIHLLRIEAVAELRIEAAVAERLLLRTEVAVEGVLLRIEVVAVELLHRPVHQDSLAVEGNSEKLRKQQEQETMVPSLEQVPLYAKLETTVALAAQTRWELEGQEAFAVLVV